MYRQNNLKKTALPAAVINKLFTIKNRRTLLHSGVKQYPVKMVPLHHIAQALSPFL